MGFEGMFLTPDHFPETQMTSTFQASTSQTRHLKIAGITLLVAAMGLQGCANSEMGSRERGGLAGAAIGAIGGAIISSSTGGKAGTGAVVGGLAGAVAGNLWSKHMQDKQRALEKATQGTGIEVAQTADNRLKLNVPSDFSFDTGSAVVKPTMKPVLDEIARNLDPAVRVEVIGHTDSRGTDEVNKPLSINRADAVRDYLTARGVASARISIDGRGESQPVASNDTAEGRAQNRRVEIFLADKGQVPAR